MDVKRKELNREMILSCAVIAIVIAVGVVFFILTFLGLDILECDSTKWVTFFFVLCGSIWGILLVRNC